jgi:hypothetical protein
MNKNNGMIKPCYLAIFALLLLTACTSPFEKQVQQAVRAQLARYPESRLQDVYKHFFQDRFGPGHLIPDTATAGAYLRYEMALYTEPQDIEPEPIGWEGNFYRISTDVVKQGFVPFAVYLEAVAQSAEDTPRTSHEAWVAEWASILQVVDRMNLSLPDFSQDTAVLRRKIEAREYDVHHSNTFERNYEPHYRIIRREIYDSRVRKWVEERYDD